MWEGVRFVVATMSQVPKFFRHKCACLPPPPLSMTSSRQLQGCSQEIGWLGSLCAKVDPPLYNYGDYACPS